MNPPTVGGKFAAKDVGGGVPDAPGGVKTPPYDAKDKGDTMARLRAGHARPLRTTVNGSRTKGAHGWLPLPFSPTNHFVPNLYLVLRIHIILISLNL